MICTIPIYIFFDFPGNFPPNTISPFHRQKNLFCLCTTNDLGNNNKDNDNPECAKNIDFCDTLDDDRECAFP